MAFETIRIDQPAPGVAALVYNRPDVANALSSQMAVEVIEAWGQLSAQDGLRCVILRGEGKHFQAGADLRERNGMTDDAWAEQHRLFEAMIRAQYACPVPVIAAVHGAAMGGGCEKVLACDFAYCTETARFALPEVGLGIMPGLGGTQMLTRAVGPRRAVEMLTSGRVISAQEALDWGLVNGVTPVDGLMDRVLEVAAMIASRAPLSVRALKRVVWEGQDLPLSQSMDLELTLYYELFKTHDRREGVASFNEKRTPQFEGR